MSREEGTFVDLCLRGEILAEEIDDFVSRWHKGGTGKKIYDFLGLTREEYGLWVEKPSSLNIVLEARKRGRRISEFQDANEVRLAARGYSEEDIEDLVVWLKQRGRIPA